jgi:polysaccharide export outer membrane protein
MLFDKTLNICMPTSSKQSIYLRKLKLQFLYILLSTIFISCGSRKEVVYFNSESIGGVAVEQKSFTPVFKVDDFLSIIITAENPETAIPFNFPYGLGLREPMNYGYTSGTPLKAGFLIDEKGEVELPIIGRVKLAGLSRVEATELLRNIYSDYLQSPVVNINIHNFKVTVLGDCAKPGTFFIPNERITILEAIGLAGDLRMTAKRNNILVIRDRDGIRQEYRVDLTKSNILNSPVYYLEQNDVVYIEPNITARSQAAFWRSTGGLFISLTSLIVTTVILITN